MRHSHSISLVFMLKSSSILSRWFGLILLPFVSFAADGTVAAVYFVRYMFRHLFHEPTPPTTLAKGEAIDLSIQFTLFWMPLLVLLGWWTNKPLTLLFGEHLMCVITYQLSNKSLQRLSKWRFFWDPVSLSTTSLQTLKQTGPRA